MDLRIQRKGKELRIRRRHSKRTCQHCNAGYKAAQLYSLLGTRYPSKNISMRFLNSSHIPHHVCFSTSQNELNNLLKLSGCSAVESSYNFSLLRFNSYRSIMQTQSHDRQWTCTASLERLISVMESSLTHIHRHIHRHTMPIAHAWISPSLEL